MSGRGILDLLACRPVCAKPTNPRHTCNLQGMPSGREPRCGIRRWRELTPQCFPGLDRNQGTLLRDTYHTSDHEFNLAGVRPNKVMFVDVLDVLWMVCSLSQIGKNKKQTGGTEGDSSANASSSQSRRRLNSCKSSLNHERDVTCD